MALQNYMNGLMEESGADTVIVITDDFTNHTFEKGASIRRSQQQENQQQEAARRNSKVSQEYDAPPMCQSRREGSGSIQASLVSMNDSPYRGQFCHDKRLKEEVVKEVNELPLSEQSRLSRSTRRSQSESRAYMNQEMMLRPRARDDSHSKL